MLHEATLVRHGQVNPFSMHRVLPTGSQIPEIITTTNNKTMKLDRDCRKS